ncbi:MAG: TlpA disulfide reductase family protein [bacterium]
MEVDQNKYFKMAGKILGILFLIIILLNVLARYLVGGDFQIIADGQDFAQNIGATTSGNPAPYFELQNLNGKFVKFSDFSGTPFVVLFWNTWNENSKKQFDILSGLIRKGDNSFNIVAIDSQQDRAIVLDFIEKGGYSKKEVLLDKNGAISDLYEARNLPVIYFIDDNGLLRDSYIGLLGENEIVDKISKFKN